MPIDIEAAERETAIAKGSERFWHFLNTLYVIRERWLGGVRNDLCDFEPRIVPAPDEPADLFVEWAKRLYRFVRTMRRIGLDRELRRAVCLANEVGTAPLKKAAWLFSNAIRGVSPAQIASVLRRQQDVERVRNAMAFICFSAMRPRLLASPLPPDVAAIQSRSTQFERCLKHSPESGPKEFLFDAPDAIAEIWAAMKQVDPKAPPRPKWATPIARASRKQLDALLDGRPWWTLADVQAALAEALAWCEGITVGARGSSTRRVDPAAKEHSLEVRVAKGQDGLVLLSDELAPYSISADLSELFKLFITKVAFGSPSEYVALEKLNYAAKGDLAREDAEKASDVLRNAINRLNRGLSKWCAPPDGQPWMQSKRGKGYYLNESLSWSIGDRDLHAELTRYSKSVFGVTADPSTMAGSTPAKGHRLPSQPRRHRSAEYHDGSDEE